MRTFILIAGVLLVSCSEIAEEPKSESLTERDSVSNQIRDLEPSEEIDLENIPGDTNAQKLIALMDTRQMAKAGALIGMDGQIEAIQTMGNEELANQLIETRPLYLQAIEESMPQFLEEMERLYAEVFTDQELERLVEIHSDPAMRKMVQEQSELSAKAVEFSRVWGEQVGKRYSELVQQETAK